MVPPALAGVYCRFPLKIETKVDSEEDRALETSTWNVSSAQGRAFHHSALTSSCSMTSNIIVTRTTEYLFSDRADPRHKIFFPAKSVGSQPPYHVYRIRKASLFSTVPSDWELILDSSLCWTIVLRESDVRFAVFSALRFQSPSVHHINSYIQINQVQIFLARAKKQHDFVSTSICT